MAAQTAKQVILQRLREAEREVVLAEFEDKIHTVLNAIVTRIEGRMVRIEINRAQGILPPSEQIQGERYHPGQRLKVYLKDVERGFKGAQLVVSRGCPEFIEHLMGYINPTTIRPLKLVMNAGNGAAGHVVNAIEEKFKQLNTLNIFKN